MNAIINAKSCKECKFREELLNTRDCTCMKLFMDVVVKEKEHTELLNQLGLPWQE